MKLKAKLARLKRRLDDYEKVMRPHEERSGTPGMYHKPGSMKK